MSEGIDQGRGSDTTHTPSKPAAVPARTARVEGLADALHSVQHELDLMSHASKFGWINKRLIVIRNAIIAFSVLAAMLVLLALCYHEA